MRRGILLFIFLFMLCLLYGQQEHISIHQIQYDEHITDADFEYAEFIALPKISMPKGLRNTYYGYLPYWIDTLYYANFRHELLTDVAYFSVDLSTAGALGAIPNAARFNKIYTNCRQFGTDIHMTVTLFGTASVSTFLNNASARSTAVTNLSNLVSTYDLDGINIDFEFVTSSVRDSFTDFISELATALHNHADGRKELSIAMPAVPPWYPGYDYYNLGLLTDGLFIMAYDYHYSGSSNPGPVAPTYNSAFWGYYAVNTTIGDYLDEGVKADKLILGMPYYGIDWPTVDDSRNSATTGSGSAVLYRNAINNAVTYSREWDSDCWNPFYDYYSTEWHQCWYDDSLSINAKLTIARDSMLQGAGCWALGYDEGNDALWNEIENVYWWEPPLEHFIVRINTPGLNARKGPASQYDVLSVVHENEEYAAFEAEGNWYKIYYPSASGPYYAWIYGGDGMGSAYAEGVTKDTLLRITASVLNIRSGATTDSAIITQTSRGQCLIADSFSGNWAHVWLADDNISGWLYYSSYSRIVPSPEDSNSLSLIIDSVICPDTVFTAEDSFTVELYMTNASYSVPGPTTVCDFTDASPFYKSEWTSSSTCGTTGFNGLPNQSFIRYAVMGIPSVTDTELVIDTFFLSRNSSAVSDTVELVVVVINSNLMIHLPDTLIVEKEPVEYETIQIFDVLGRKVDTRSIPKGIYSLPNLKPGIYFIRTESGVSKEIHIR